ncbi:hypothetical protein BJ741DRAFT_583783 [Chytriomyces cf. hyalinus JEL632]|nr:hypothetical protein BJ741DRAFT_583783 [Chytriomyces cf. hyalinus JEL632]
MASDSLHACSNFSQPNAPRQYQTKNSFHGYKQTMREKERMGVAVELCNLAIVGLSSLALLFFFILATPMVLPIVIRMCCGLGVPQNYEDRSRMQVAVKRVLQKLPLMEYSGNCSSVGQNTSASTKTRFSHARCTICLDEYGTFEK